MASATEIHMGAAIVAEKKENKNKNDIEGLFLVDIMLSLYSQLFLAKVELNTVAHCG